jgi:hypothetical protein
VDIVHKYLHLFRVVANIHWSVASCFSNINVFVGPFRPVDWGSCYSNSYFILATVSYSYSLWNPPTERDSKRGLLKPEDKDYWSKYLHGKFSFYCVLIDLSSKRSEIPDVQLTAITGPSRAHGMAFFTEECCRTQKDIRYNFQKTFKPAHVRYRQNAMPNCVLVRRLQDNPPLRWRQYVPRKHQWPPARKSALRQNPQHLNRYLQCRENLRSQLNTVPCSPRRFIVALTDAGQPLRDAVCTENGLNLSEEWLVPSSWHQTPFLAHNSSLSP